MRDFMRFKLYEVKIVFKIYKPIESIPDLNYKSEIAYQYIFNEKQISGCIL